MRGRLLPSAAGTLLVLAVLGLTARPATAATPVPAAPQAVAPAPAPVSDADPSPAPSTSESPVPGPAPSATPLPAPPRHAPPTGNRTHQPSVQGDFSPNPELTASFFDTTVVDHQQTNVTLHLARINTFSVASGLGYTLTLPGTLVVASTSVTNTCGGTVSVTEGGSTIQLSGASLAIAVASCDLAVAVASPASGSYQIDSASVSGLAGSVLNTVTTQTLTVTPAAALLDAGFSPASMAAMATDTMSLSLTRTDTNVSAAQSGLGYLVTLPTDLLVTAGTRTNGCGGTFAASGSTISLSGAAIAAGHASCAVTFKVTTDLAGDYVMDATTSSSLVGVVPYFGGCVAAPPHARRRIRPHGGSCPLQLTVTKLAQSITFPQPGVARLPAGTAHLSATSSSHLTVTFTSTTLSVCTVSGATVTLLTAGTCTIEADQAGDGTWSAAGTVSRSFAVTVPVAPPIGVTASAGVSSITATWSPPGDPTGVTGYLAIAHPGPATCTTTGTSCVLGGTAGVTYTVTVVALSPGLGDSTEAGPSNEVTPSAPPVAGTPPATVLDLTTNLGHISSAAPGEHLVVIGTGFAAYSTAIITVYSTPVVLGTVVTDGHGHFSKPVTIPAVLASGQHTLVAAGVDPRGRPQYLGLSIVVGLEDGDELPRTGTDLSDLLLAGLVLALTGTVTRVGARPRRR